MNKEDKELLLKDLCARLPYGVIVRHADCLVDSDGNYTGQFWYKRGYLYDICRLDNMTTTIIESDGSDEEGYEHICDLERSLPYLRPMFSMTDEEINELKNLCSFYIPSDSKTIGFEDYGILVVTHHITNNTYSFKLNVQVIDWLNAHHFDYRTIYDEDKKKYMSMIEKGLAIAVTKENNPYGNN